MSSGLVLKTNSSWTPLLAAGWLGSPKVRVSYWTADWHDGSDIQALKDVCRTGDIRQLSLLPLNDAEIGALASERVDNPVAFIVSAR